MFGLGQSTEIDLPAESTGVMPSRDWKRDYRGIAWYPGDTINVSIGQGFTLTTPLQLAKMTAMLARRGGNIKPSILRAMDAPEFLFENPFVLKANTESAHWEAIFAGMESVMHSNRGTAYIVGSDSEYRIAGKTGTAQVVGIEQGAEYDSEQLKERQRDHALFVGFAPIENPGIAVAIILENGEQSTKAAAIAKALMDEWYRLERQDLADISENLSEGVSEDFDESLDEEKSES